MSMHDKTVVYAFFGVSILLIVLIVSAVSYLLYRTIPILANRLWKKRTSTTQQPDACLVQAED